MDDEHKKLPWLAVAGAAATAWIALQQLSDRNRKRDELMDKQIAEAERREKSERRRLVEGVEVEFNGRFGRVVNRSKRPINDITCKVMSKVDRHSLDTPAACGEGTWDGHAWRFLSEAKPVSRFETLRTEATCIFTFDKLRGTPDAALVVWFTDDDGFRWQLDSGDLAGSRHWTGRSMEWALEAGDQLMMSWALYRRGEHAAADGDAAAGLAAAARREGGDLPGPMLAAIFQQEAHAHALDGAESACLDTLDQALERAASPDDPGDASSGHGSFCTPAYVEMQRGRYWLLLGQPAKARAALDGAVRTLPPVYRRDRGVALSALAATHAAIGEPGEAATAALQALEVARDAGSERIVSMVIPVANALARHRGIGAVVQLQEALAEPPGA